MVILTCVGEHHSNVPIIETAHDLATAYQDDLQVLHVIPDADTGSHFQRLQRIPTFSDDEFKVSPQQAESVAERLIEKALDDLNSDRILPVGRVGEPGEEILRLADEIDARYLVIGGRKRTPAGKALFGSIAQQVILDADRPVVTRSTTPDLSA